jgi:hypothetical protein
MQLKIESGSYKKEQKNSQESCIFSYGDSNC